jgi:hypothetical protein
MASAWFSPYNREEDGFAMQYAIFFMVLPSYPGAYAPAGRDTEGAGGRSGSQMGHA